MVQREPRGPSDLAGIYSITHIKSGKRYIGSSVRFSVRFTQHRQLLRRRDHHCLPLQYAWLKYGETAFKFKILEIVEDRSRNSLLAREQHYFDLLKPEYNICKDSGPRKAFKLSLKPHRTISCAYCFSEYNTRRLDTLYCSRECKEMAKWASGRYRETRTCIQCGSSFSVKKYNTTTACSKKCAALRWRATQRTNNGSGKD